MTYGFKMPDLGEGAAEAEIAAWHVKAGEMVAEDQLLVDVMTDKATVELTSPVSGRVVGLHGEPGDRVRVGALLAEFETGAAEGGGAEPVNAPQTAAPAPLPEAADSDKAASGATEDGPAHVEDAPHLPLASPLVRRVARDRGIALGDLRGSGPHGRILMRDLERMPAAPPGDEVEEVRIIGLRRRIAERMQEAKRQIPHFGYVEEIDMTALEDLRAELNRTRSDGMPKLSFLPFFITAIVRLVPDFPSINARYDAGKGVLSRHLSVHVGIATQTPGGLMVPVVRHAERLDLWSLAAEIARVTEAARDGRATAGELAGSTITITSLGPLGGLSAMPIINAPEVAILGPNRIEDRPVVRSGRIVVRRMMNLSGAFDHRIIDGAEAAQFVHGMKRLIECPALLFVTGAGQGGQGRKTP